MEITVQEAKQEILADKMMHIPVGSTSARVKKNYIDPNANSVMVIDQFYFMHNFKAQSSPRQHWI